MRGHQLRSAKKDDFYKKPKMFNIAAWNADKNASDVSQENQATLWKLTRTLPVNVQVGTGFLAVIQASTKYVIPSIQFLHKHGMEANASGYAYIGATPFHTSTLKATFSCDDKVVCDALKTMFQNYVLDFDAKDVIVKVPESNKKKFEMFMAEALSLVQNYSFDATTIKFENYEEPPRPMRSPFGW